MASVCSNPIGGFTAAWEIIPDQFEWFTNIANGYIQAANTFTQVLADYDIVPIDFQPIVWDETTTYTAFVPPTEPADFVAPDSQFTTVAPEEPDEPNIDTSGLDVPFPSLVVPTAPPILIPPPPIVSFPVAPDSPAILDPAAPIYAGGPLPEVPTLYELHLPDAPVINIDDFTIERPVFIDPAPLSDTYWNDVTDFRSLIWTGVDAETGATGVYDMHPRLQAMLAGGTGLPANIEQALFDRAIGRDEISSIQAVAQAEREWGARGFDLPGTTLLAKVQEIRQSNRAERGRINRELSIQFHNQEIENLRFSVDKAIAFEGMLLEAHTRIYDVARQLADGHWVVIKGIYDSQLDIFKLYLDIYKTDVDVYKTLLQAELTKLEVYKAELDAQKLINDINQQYVDIYKTELEAVMVNVEVFKAEVDAYNAQLNAEKNKIEIFKAEIDAYTATLEGEKIKYDIYDSQLGAEETKAKIYDTQVNAYATRISAYKVEVEAEATKVDAETRVVESETRVYASKVDAWKAGIDADTRNLEAFVQVYKANLDKYTALLSAEQYRVQGESRNTELNIEEEKARVAALLKQGDQSIEQLKHITSLGLSATETAATVNSQLAAAAMAAMSVSAGMTSTNSVSASDDRNCSTTYSGII